MLESTGDATLAGKHQQRRHPNFQVLNSGSVAGTGQVSVNGAPRIWSGTMKPDRRPNCAHGVRGGTDSSLQRRRHGDKPARSTEVPEGRDGGDRHPFPTSYYAPEHLPKRQPGRAAGGEYESASQVNTGYTPDAAGPAPAGRNRRQSNAQTVQLTAFHKRTDHWRRRDDSIATGAGGGA